MTLFDLMSEILPSLSHELDRHSPYPVDAKGGDGVLLFVYYPDRFKGRKRSLEVVLRRTHFGTIFSGRRSTVTRVTQRILCKEWTTEVTRE